MAFLINWNKSDITAQELYNVRENDFNGLLLDSITAHDIINDDDNEAGIIVFDALIIENQLFERKANVFQHLMKGKSHAVDVVSYQVTEPFKRNGTLNRAIIFELDDGQTVSVYLHNPDVTDKTVQPTDNFVSYKWMLNKRDITILVAPEKGSDISPREVTTRIMKLAGKNSEAFKKANANRAAKLSEIKDLTAQVEAKEAELAQLQKELSYREHMTDAEKAEQTARLAGVSVNDEGVVTPAPADGSVSSVVLPKNEVEVTSVTLAWSEASDVENKEFNSLDELQAFIASEYDNDESKIPARGYDKHRITVKIGDGEIAERIDVSAVDGDFNPFKKSLDEYMSGSGAFVGLLEKHGDVVRESGENAQILGQKTLLDLTDNPVYQQILKDSHGGIMYSHDVSEYDVTELMSIWNSLSPDVQESADGIVKGVMAFAKRGYEPDVEPTPEQPQVANVKIRDAISYLQERYFGGNANAVVVYAQGEHKTVNNNKQAITRATNEFLNKYGEYGLLYSDSLKSPSSASNALESLGVTVDKSDPIGFVPEWLKIGDVYNMSGDERMAAAEVLYFSGLLMGLDEPVVNLSNGHTAYNYKLSDFEKMISEGKIVKLEGALSDYERKNELFSLYVNSKGNEVLRVIKVTEYGGSVTYDVKTSSSTSFGDTFEQAKKAVIREKEYVASMKLKSGYDFLNEPTPEKTDQYESDRISFNITYTQDEIYDYWQDALKNGNRLIGRNVTGKTYGYVGEALLLSKLQSTMTTEAMRISVKEGTELLEWDTDKDKPKNGKVLISLKPQNQRIDKQNPFSVSDIAIDGGYISGGYDGRAVLKSAYDEYTSVLKSLEAEVWANDVIQGLDPHEADRTYLQSVINGNEKEAMKDPAFADNLTAVYERVKDDEAMLKLANDAITYYMDYMQKVFQNGGVFDAATCGANDPDCDNDDDSSEDGDDDFDAEAEWDACSGDDDEDVAMDGDFKGHPFRGNQYKKASRESGAAVHASKRAKRAEKSGDKKALKSAHKTAAFAHKAAAVDAKGKAKKYHNKMAKFHAKHAGMMFDSADNILDFDLNADIDCAHEG